MADSLDRTESSLFAAAIELQPEEQAAFLNRECAGNTALRARLDALLIAHNRRGHLLDRPPLAADLEATVVHYSSQERPGVVIAGRYKLLEEIGQGGMGTVWVAEQTTPVQRKVAIKVIKAGMDSRQVLARFEAERQALAMMDHTNIAKVLDGGLTETGRPYFAMEYVKGVAITEYCDANQLNIAERLQLFVQVCSAVQHAHQKGIIHRDLKPSNILVAPYDDRPVPKVIDFGLAKAMYHPLTERTLHTAHETVLGTPLYISPEQAQLNNIDVDTRADIYSLGVLLYELLTGTTPLERKRFQEAAWDEVRRIIREEEPPCPSMRLSSTDTLPSLAACRQSEPARLTREIRGDLDWIAMKALEKDRGRRYETANAFAADVQRYLGGEAVFAHPPSAGYRLKKLIRRHRGPVIAASLVLLSLVGGVIGTTWGLVRADEQRRLAVQSQYNEAQLREKAEKSEKLAQEQKQLAIQSQRNETRLRKEAEESEKQAQEQKQLAIQSQRNETRLRKEAEESEKQAQEQKRRAVEFRDITLDALRSTTGTDVEKLIGERQSLGPNERAYLGAIVERWQKLASVEGNDEQARALRGEAHFRVGVLWQKLGRRNEARGEYESALQIQEKLASDFPASGDYRSSLATTQNNLGLLLSDLGERDEAAEILRTAISVQKKLTVDFPQVPNYRNELARSHNNLGNLLTGQDAMEEFGRAVAIQEKLVTEYPTNAEYRTELAGARSNLGKLSTELGKWPEAESHYSKSVAIYEKLVADFPNEPRHRWQLAGTYLNLGNLLIATGKQMEAADELGKSVAVQEIVVQEFPAVPDYSRDLASSHNSLGALMYDVGKVSEAIDHFTQALEIQKKLVTNFPLPEYRANLARSHNNLGRVLNEVNNRPEALEHYREALAIQKKLFADSPSEPAYRFELARSHNGFGFSLSGAGDWAAAELQYHEALALQSTLATEFPKVPAYRLELAGTHVNLGNLMWNGFNKQPEGKEQYDQALTIMEKLAAESKDIPEYRSQLAQTQNNVGFVFASQGKLPEAEEQFRKAIAIQEKLVDDYENVVDYQTRLSLSYRNLGLLLSSGDSPAQSLRWFNKAIARLKLLDERKTSLLAAKVEFRNAYANRAGTYERLQRFAEALQDWDQAIDLSPESEKPDIRSLRIISLSNNGQVDEAIAEVKDLMPSASTNPGKLYNFTCVYAVAAGKVADKKQEYGDRAMELLRMAIKAGFKDADHMGKDHDLDSLREREDFKKVIAELVANKKPE